MNSPDGGFHFIFFGDVPGHPAGIIHGDPGVDADPRKRKQTEERADERPRRFERSFSVGVENCRDGCPEPGEKERITCHKKQISGTIDQREDHHREHHHRKHQSQQLTDQIADALMEYLQPKGAIVMMEAEHMCMTMRGIKKTGSKTVTMSMRGEFEENEALVNRFMMLVKN